MNEYNDPTGESFRGSLGGAVAAQRGFEYQLNVSVLAALKLLLISNATTTIILEAASEEDMEADLAADEPGCATPIANVTGSARLVIQVKLSTGNPWSVAAFKRLLNHGKRRQSASSHLADPRVRYLLVTTADATGEARNLLVDEFLERPDATSFPRSLRDILPHSPDGRVAIWGQLSERRLQLEIQHIFSLLSVPQNKQDACLFALRAEAKARMLGVYSGAWVREDLLVTIRQYDGSWGGAGVLKKFVPPSNFCELEEMLDRKNAVVITGRSGIGKTYAALALCELARKSEPVLNVISIDASSSPSTVRQLPGPGLALIYVEDPWGQYSLRPGADAWTTQLPALLRAAEPGKRYIITSRNDMLTSAGATELLKPWAVELDSENYVSGELELIYEHNMQLLRPHLQLKALEFQPRVLERLDTPLELDLYFSQLMQGPEPGEVDPAFLSRVLALSHREAVEDVVLQYLRAMSDERAPAQIWALLATRGNFDRNQLAGIQRALRKLDPSLAGGLDKVTDRLIATRHLRQPSALISFSHPSVRAGFEVFIRSSWSGCEYALEQLISALTSLPDQLNAWGVETAARVVAEVRELAVTAPHSVPDFQPDEASQAKIDAWLEDALLDESAEFPALLRLASKSGSSTSIPCEVARWFVQRFRRGGDYFAENWQPREFDDAWYERVYVDSSTALIAARFIRIQLPRDDGNYSDDFPAQLSRLAIGLEKAFIDAARSLIGEGFIQVAELIAREAVRDLDAYLSVVDASLDDIRQIDLRDEVEKPVQLRIADGELSEAAKDYYEDFQDDAGWSSATLVEAYVVARRAAGAWEDLASHPRASELSLIWAQCAQKAHMVPCEAEVLALFLVTETAGIQYAAWDLARKYWFQSLHGKLLEQILCFAEDDQLRWAAVRCACKVSCSTLSTCFQYLSSEPASFVRLIVDIHDAMEFEDHAELRITLGVESISVLEIFDALSKKNHEEHGLGIEARELLETAMDQGCPYVVAAIAPILIEHGVLPHAITRKWMQAAIDPVNARAAVAAAIELGDLDGVTGALKHARADARALALEHRAAAGKVPLAPDLLALADDPGSQVRMALICALADKPHADHLGVLMKLATDSWDESSPRYNEPPSYPIAQNAVKALAAYSVLSDETGNALILLAVGTKDITLRNLSLQLAAKNCSALVQEKIWEMVQTESKLDLRLAAADAIALAPHLASSVLDKISNEGLHGHPASLALSLVRLFSLHLEIGEALRRFEQLSQQPSQRVLLVVGMVYLRNRDYDAAEQVCRLLGKEHPVCHLVSSPEKKLPRSVLNDLGDVRLRNAVQTRMAWLFRRG